MKNSPALTLFAYRSLAQTPSSSPGQKQLNAVGILDMSGDD